jgi:uncharacterized protein (TIGR03435 family)
MIRASLTLAFLCTTALAQPPASTDLPNHSHHQGRQRRPILTRGAKELQLKPPKDPGSDPRAIVFTFQGGVANGQATGNNTTTDYLAQRLGRYLQFPVLNQTGIAGTYDFDLPAVDPENHDLQYAVLSVVDRLGLKIKRSRGPIQTLIIDQINQPTEN